MRDIHLNALANIKKNTTEVLLAFRDVVDQQRERVVAMLRDQDEMLDALNAEIKKRLDDEKGNP